MASSFLFQRIQGARSSYPFPIPSNNLMKRTGLKGNDCPKFTQKALKLSRDANQKPPLVPIKAITHLLIVDSELER